MKHKRDVAIYKLTDPRNGAVRYIGRTRDIHKRFAFHILDTSSNPGKTAWIKDLNAAHLLPLVEVIETVNQDDSYERERYWIDFYRRRGARLTNVHGNTNRRGRQLELPFLMDRRVKPPDIENTDEFLLWPLDLRIHMLRWLAHLSCRALDKKAGLPPSTVIRIEKGQQPEFKHVIAIAQALDMTPVALLRGLDLASDLAIWKGDIRGEETSTD